MVSFMLGPNVVNMTLAWIRFGLAGAERNYSADSATRRLQRRRPRKP